MIIKRDRYLNKLIERKENGMVKVITGIRRCGKSFLLNNIYKEYLLSIGIKTEQIIQLALDQDRNIKYRNPIILGQYIRSLASKVKGICYVFLDEIQKVAEIKNPYLDSENERITFVDTLLGLMAEKNIDLYVTGSNSKMLSSDIITTFRDRGDEIRLYPLSYSEFYSTYSLTNNRHAWRDYLTYGGMPFILSRKNHEDKSKYLLDLFKKTYITDIVERHNISNDIEVIDDLLNYSASSVGSLTNPTKLENTFKSEKKISISHATISNYLDYFEDAYLIKKAYRYNIKGRKYIGSPLKYYYTDLGLRNARLNFRQLEENHIMENIIYNELIMRGFNVDVGSIEDFERDENGKTIRKHLEIDFIATNGSNCYYIQSALSLVSEDKKLQETKSLNKIKNSFKKIIVIKDDIIPWHDNDGILYIGIEQFLLEENAINL